VLDTYNVKNPCAQVDGIGVRTHTDVKIHAVQGGIRVGTLKI